LANEAVAAPARALFDPASFLLGFSAVGADDAASIASCIMMLAE